MAKSKDEMYKRKGLIELGPEVYADKDSYKKQTKKAGRKGFGIGAGLGALGGALAGLLSQTLKGNKDS